MESPQQAHIHRGCGGEYPCSNITADLKCKHASKCLYAHMRRNQTSMEAGNQCLCTTVTKKWGSREVKLLLLVTAQHINKNMNRGRKSLLKEAWDKVKQGMYSHTSLNYSVDFLKKKYSLIKKDWKKSKADNKLKKHKASKSGASPPSSPVRPFVSEEVESILSNSSKKDLNYKPRELELQCDPQSYDKYKVRPDSRTGKKPTLTGPKSKKGLKRKRLQGQIREEIKRRKQARFEKKKPKKIEDTSSLLDKFRRNLVNDQEAMLHRVLRKQQESAQSLVRTRQERQKRINELTEELHALQGK